MPLNVVDKFWRKCRRPPDLGPALPGNRILAMEEACKPFYVGVNMERSTHWLRKAPFFDRRRTRTAELVTLQQIRKMKYYVVFNLLVSPNHWIKLFYHDLAGAREAMMQHPESRMRTFSSKKEALNFYREGSDDEDKVTPEDQEFKIKYYVVVDVQVTRDRWIKLFFHDMAGARAVMILNRHAKLKTFSSKEDALQYYHEGSADDEAEEAEGSGGL